MDNVDCINGVFDENGVKVIREYTEEEKDFLNKFNAEYYNAAFDKDDSQNLHKTKGDSTLVYNVRERIRELKAEQYKEKDYDKLKALYEEIEELNEYLAEIYPKKKCTDENNSRNRCLLNRSKKSGELKFISWETVDPSTVADSDMDTLYVLNNKEVDEDDD